MSILWPPEASSKLHRARSIEWSDVVVKELSALHRVERESIKKSRINFNIIIIIGFWIGFGSPLFESFTMQQHRNSCVDRWAMLYELIHFSNISVTSRVYCARHTEPQSPRSTRACPSCSHVSALCWLRARWSSWRRDIAVEWPEPTGAHKRDGKKRV